MDNRGSSSPPPSDGTVFTGALELPAAERAAFVAQACGGDTQQRARIEALLQAHREAPAFLKTVTRADAAAGDPAGPGDHIGRYRLLLKLGEGGCGVVYMAEQEEPVRRRVALKIIKAGMDTREVVARFEAERQALAMMDHPGIARVLDGGATASGRPYFVMELVRGVTITKYCDENSLPTRARLELFIQVCHAVQHAHQKGVIHRDLKPSNILVTLHDNVAAPKVIDFGIAKATHGRLTDATLFTAYAQFLGTPAYMSPEQAEMTGLDIDTRSDVYSLGVLLYELLTGRVPFDPKALQNPSIDEMRRVIREVEPKKPSTHLDTLNHADRDTVAGRRSTDADKLRLLLAGDLDWIVLKALEKNRARRYETPAALADDIARHLADEAVMARPPSTLYRAGKFARRYRVGVAAAAVVMTTLVVATIVSVALAVRATKASKAEAVARSDAQRRQEQAEKLLFFMLGDLREQLKSANRLDLIESVVDKAIEYVASLDRRDLTDTTRLGKMKALSLIGAVRVQQKRLADAAATLTAAYALAAELTARNPTNGEMLFERSQVEYWMATIYRRRGDLTATADWISRYRDSAVELVKLDPTSARWQKEFASAHHNLAVLELDRGNLEAAREGFLARLAMVEKMAEANPADGDLQFNLTTTISFLGTVAERSGNLAEALVRYRDQTARLETLLAANPKDLEWRFRIAVSRCLQVDVFAITGHFSEARELLARAINDFEALVAHDAGNRRWLLNSLTAQIQQIQIERAEGRLASAAQRLAEVRSRIETLAAAEPSDRNTLGWLVVAWRLETELRLALNQPTAVEAANRAVDRALQLLKDARADDRMLGECAMAYIAAGSVATVAGQDDQARGQWRRAIGLLQPRLADSGDWRLLDPAARAKALLNERIESQSIIARLHGFGYRPLNPWP